MAPRARTFELGEALTFKSAAFIGEGRVVCGFQETPLRVVELSSGEVVMTLSAKEHDTRCLAVSADEKRLVSGHGSWGGVKVWNLETGALLHDLDESIMWVGAVRFDASGRVLVAKGSMTWVFSADGELETEPDNDGGKSLPVALSNDGAWCCVLRKKAVVLSAFGKSTSRTLGTLPGDHTDKGVIAFSPDGSLVAAADPVGNVRVWRCADGELVRSIDGEDLSVDGLAVFADRLVLLENPSLDPGRLRIITGEAVETLDVAGDVLAVSPSGKRVVVGTSSGALHVIEL